MTKTKKRKLRERRLRHRSAVRSWKRLTDPKPEQSQSFLFNVAQINVSRGELEYMNSAWLEMAKEFALPRIEEQLRIVSAMQAPRKISR